jgi:hypothetical protein
MTAPRRVEASHAVATPNITMASFDSSPRQEINPLPRCGCRWFVQADAIVEQDLE